MFGKKDEIPPEARDPEEKRRDPSPAGMGMVYAIFGALTAVFFAAALLWAHVPIVDRFAAELATTCLGIVLTLAFVQRVIERQERFRRLRTSIGALRKGSRAIQPVVQVWADLLKAAHPRPPERPFGSLDELFAPHVTAHLSSCNLTAVPMAEGADEDGSGTWLDRAAERIHDLRRQLNDIIVAYGSSLDATYVEAVDDIVDDPFLELVEGLARSGERDPNRVRHRLNNARSAREVHFHRLLHLIRVHNDLATQAAKVRSRRTAPRTGTIGMELPLDHDLKVLAPLGTKWWAALPTPGSLCMEPDAEDRPARALPGEAMDRRRGAQA